MPLLHLIEAACAKYGHKNAIIDKNCTRFTTYDELMVQARNVAAYLQQKTLPQQSFVCLKMPLCMEFIATEIGIWLSGHISVPIGDNYPEARIKKIQEHCDAQLTIDLDLYTQAQKEANIYQKQLKTGGENKALLIYTSGSTGTPKGILHDFESLMNAFHLYEDFSPSEKDKFAYGAPIYFIAQLQYFQFVYGVEVHMLDESVTRNVDALAKYYTDHKITMTTISPAVLSIFKNTDPHLKCVWTGSENVVGLGPQDFRLYNLYGCTETGGPMCYAEITEASDHPSAGKPVAGIEYKIIDGEICFKGHFCCGYFKDKELTDKLYQDGWLHTGDLGKLLPNGDIQYINRKDWMVKINGQRVEPGEIEAAMKKIEGIDDAIVKGFDNGQGSHYLVGFYTGEKEHDSEYLRTQLGQHISAYMIPLQYVRLDAMPINANGKKDRTKLLPPIVSIAGNNSDANNEKEAMLCMAFAKVLGMESVGPDDDFIALGGDSIKIMKVLQLLQGYNISSETIARERTARKLSNHITTSENITNRTCERGDSCPLTQAQMGIYAECKRREGEAVYNVTNIFRLSKRLDSKRLARAVDDAIKAHPALLSQIIEEEDGTPRMEYRALEEDEELCRYISIKEEDIDDLIAELRRPYRLDGDRLIRPVVVDTPENQYLCVGIHHIVFDGLSRQAFYQDIDTAYREGHVSRETITGFDIAAREEMMLGNTNDLKKAHDWYIDEFGDAESTAIPAPDITNGGDIRYGEQRRYLSTSSQEFTDLCQRLGASPVSVMYSVIGRLLSVYTGKKDVTFATIWHGRHSSDTLHTIMMMVKTLPVRCRFDNETTLADLAQGLKKQVGTARENDIYSYADLNAETGLTSDMLFAYHGSIRGIPQIDGSELDLLDISENETGEQLAMSVMMEDDKLFLLTEYHSNKYSEDFISRFTDSFDAVLAHMVENPDTKVCDISIISETHRKELDAFCQQKTIDLPIKTFHEGIERWAAEKPDARAVVACDRTLTYKEYNERANRVARALIAKGVSKGDRIVLLLPRTSDFLVSLFAIMKCGAAYIPMDPAYPADRISYILEDSEGRFVITTSNHVADYADRSIDIAELIKDSEQFESTNPNVDVEPNDLAYLIYTSGSTGKPKGVMLEHLGVANFLTASDANMVVAASTRFASVTLCQTTVSFDLSIFEYGASLFNGNTVVFANEEEAINPIAQVELCKRAGVECISGTPSRIATNLELHDYEELVRKQIKAIHVGGEKLPWALVERMKEYNVTLINGYGPTETTMGSSGAYMNDATYVHVGKPIHNYSYRILDADRHEVPVGVMGELTIGGLSLARGYNKLPEKTADVFIQWNGERVYRTGDYARWTNEGNVIILGRTDNQVKLNGLRIELGEIETVMAKQPGIKQCVVIIKKVGDVDKLVAYYTVEEGQQLTIDEIKSGMSEHLTHYMVPGVFVQLKTMPITPAGKVDVKHLPEPKAVAEEIIKPANEKEEQLYNIVAEIIGTQDFGVTTNLLSAGLSSLLAIRLSILLKKKMGIAIKVADIMATPTIRKLVSIMPDETEGLSSKKPLAEKNRQTTDCWGTFYPLTFAQQGVYFDCLKNPDTTLYNMPMLLHIPSTVQAEELRCAVEKVIALHSALFCHIINIDDEAVMIYPKDIAAKVETVDMTSDELQDFKSTAVQPFDLTNGPLYRAKIIQSEGRLFLFLDTHHLVSDGSSMDIIYQQICDVMNGKEITGESYSYFAFADSQYRYAQSADFLNSIEFFDDAMKDYEESPAVPFDFNATDLGSQGIAAEPIDDIITNVDDFCKGNGFTPAQFWYGVVNFALGRYADTNEVYMCGISGGRQNLDIADTVGMFVNTLALHTSIGNDTAKDYIVHAAKTFAKAMEHENFPFSTIAANYGFQPKFNYVYQLGLMNTYTINGEAITIEGLDTQVPKFPVSVSIEYIDAKPCVSVLYDSALYRAESISGFIRSVITIAKAIISQPESLVQDLYVLPSSLAEELAQKRQAMPSRRRQKNNTTQGVEPCANETEQVFCDIFGKILGRNDIGALGNFFELGGTSLLAVRVVIEAMNAGYKIDYKTVFDNPTPRKLSAMLNNTLNPEIPKVPNTSKTTTNSPLDSKYTLLKLNTLDEFRRGERQHIGGAIVTGATGYLGLHVVKELIDRADKPKIYCLVRSNKVQTALSRMRALMFYYFDDSYDELIGKRLFIVDGDVTKPETFDQLPTSADGITHLFNCAANVKHFSAGTDIEDINLGGARNCIEFCIKAGIMMVQTSTHSVAGTTVSDHPVAAHNITEQELYWGQTLDNQYIHAKFEAEKAVIEAVETRGLNAKIMRLGNLSARSTDGEFQVNFSSNSFMGRIRAYQAVGCIPYEAMSASMEFSPINEVARAVVMLSETPRANIIFHPVNANSQNYGNVINCLNRLGINISLTEQADFQAKLIEAAADESKTAILQSMLAYDNVADGKFVVFNGVDYLFTTQVLMRMGFQWSFTTWDYIERFITAIKGLGFFDEEYER